MTWESIGYVLLIAVIYGLNKVTMKGIEKLKMRLMRKVE
mgnify:CR=1 FL=1